MFKAETNTTKNRYDLSRFCRGVKEDDGLFYFDVADSDFLFYLHKINDMPKYLIQVEEGRPDLLSEILYGTGNPQFWWILLEVNDLKFPWEMKSGMMVKYPLLSQLEDIYYKLNPVNNKSNGNVKPKFTRTTTEIIE